MRLSIVTTLYCSDEYVTDFYQRATAVANELVNEDYEIIFVNDGSPDNSLTLAIELSETDEHVVVVDLSRNFGHHKAIMTGLKYTQGERVFLIDSDLEEQPEWLHDFSSKMDEERCDVVFGVQENRKGGITEKIAGNLFYKIFRFLTRVQQPDNIVTARLMSRRYVLGLLEHRETEINIGGLWVITGFSQYCLKVKKSSTSLTTYSFAKKLSHLVTAITSFSSAPLVLIFYIGLFVSGVSGIYVCYLFINYFFFSAPLSGYTSLISSIWLLSGLIILFMGVQGIYISKMYMEVKRRPLTIVRDVFRNSARVEVQDEGRANEKK